MGLSLAIKKNVGSSALELLLNTLIRSGASDLHVKVGRPPLYRINGRLVPAKTENLSEQEIFNLINSFLNEHQLNELSVNKYVDCSFEISESGRFRANVFFQKGTPSAVIRMIPLDVPKIEDLSLPFIVKELCMKTKGLVLVTGATGSGKTTTLASMIQYINENRRVHILTIEDPIEFVFFDQKASVTQRELGVDVMNAKEALKAGLRQDPDIIVVGELRDYEMIQTALTAAETGHLVLATLHTQDAKGTLERIIDVFPGVSKGQVRLQLASVLVGVISQHLLSKKDGTGRVPAVEVMINSPMISECVRKNDFDSIQKTIEKSNKYYGMQTLDQSLEELITNKLISKGEGLKVSLHPKELEMRLSGITREEGFDNSSD